MSERLTETLRRSIKTIHSQIDQMILEKGITPENFVMVFQTMKNYYQQQECQGVWDSIQHEDLSKFKELLAISEDKEKCFALYYLGKGSQNGARSLPSPPTGIPEPLSRHNWRYICEILDELAQKHELDPSRTGEKAVTIMHELATAIKGLLK